MVCASRCLAVHFMDKKDEMTSSTKVTVQQPGWGSDSGVWISSVSCFAIQPSFNPYLPRSSVLGRHSGEGVRPHRGWGRAQNGVTGQLLGALRVGLGGRPVSRVGGPLQVGRSQGGDLEMGRSLQALDGEAARPGEGGGPAGCCCRRSCV